MTVPQKGQADHLELGSWNAICSVCGRKYKASEMVKQPDGVGTPWGGGTYVCKRDYRPRQPQDFVRGIPDKMAPPWVQPWPADGQFQRLPVINITENTDELIVFVNVGSPSSVGVRLVIVVAPNVTLSQLTLTEVTTTDSAVYFTDEVIINNSGIIENLFNPDEIDLEIRNWGGSVISTGYVLMIEADTADYDVYAEFVAVYGVPPTDVELTIVVEPGVIVSSETPGTAAITFGTSWTGTPEFTLLNNGYIIGLGGSGGLGAGQTDAVTTVPGAIGDSGGNAIDLNGNSVTITNGSGFIFGGGGGGGGGALMVNDEGAAGGYAGGGGGGVGAGAASGFGGVAGSTFVKVTFTLTSAAANGTEQSDPLPAQLGVAGGIGAEVARILNGHTVIGGTGGTGGNYGEDGLEGATGSGTATPVQLSPPSGLLAGGFAGKAIELGVGGSAVFVSGDGPIHVKGAVS